MTREWVYIGLCRGYIGIMERKMETTIGFRVEGLGLGALGSRHHAGAPSKQKERQTD